MKIKGFTLAEVLITLGIIGVVSALVLPQFTTNTYNQAHAAKLSTVLTDYENIFGMMLLKESADTIFDTEFGKAYSAGAVSTSAAAMKTALGNYAKINRTGTSTSGLGYLSKLNTHPIIPSAFAANTIMHDINGGAVDSDTFNFVLGVSTSSGAVLFFKAPQKITVSTDSWMVATIFIDVNGSGSPNKFGRDVFAVVLDEDGHLFPYGSSNAAEVLGLAATNVWDNANANTSTKCNDANYNGLGCTARLIENNYKIDY